MGSSSILHRVEYKMRSIVWFREDLRIQDNPAVFEAAEASIDGIVGLYIIDEMMWQKNHMAACRIEFILRGIAKLSEALSALHIPLLIRQVKKTEDIPAVVLSVIEEVKAKSLFFNYQYELNESERDKSVEVFLKKAGIKTHGYHDQMVLKPRKAHTKTFAAYKRLWTKQFIQQGGVRLLPPVYEQRSLDISADPVPASLPGIHSDIPASLWPAGEQDALKRLEHFIENNLTDYDKMRDYPAADVTSKLSPYLALGMISPRKCFAAVLEANDNRLGDGNSGAVQWMNELIWRDFYKHIVITVPRISLNEAYQEHTQDVPWAFDQEKYDAWTEGRTGFPIVDAAMRQLKATGWMHNRLRLITATFFTKYMFFDWRLGQDYFMRHLIDGDFSANNGGWQWCASTGTDTTAYFRYFDPLRQSDRYDPDGAFIKQYCPELTDISPFAVHFPHTRARAQAEKTDYPRPMLDLKESRVKANESFRDGVKKKA
jgi:deoxyribodipyrimidine photo-lyase